MKHHKVPQTDQLHHTSSQDIQDDWAGIINYDCASKAQMGDEKGKKNEQTKNNANKLIWVAR